jgi:hypothetical protein
MRSSRFIFHTPPMKPMVLTGAYRVPTSKGEGTGAATEQMWEFPILLGTRGVTMCGPQNSFTPPPTSIHSAS